MITFPDCIKCKYLKAKEKKCEKYGEIPKEIYVCDEHCIKYEKNNNIGIFGERYENNNTIF